MSEVDGFYQVTAQVYFCPSITRTRMDPDFDLKFSQIAQWLNNRHGANYIYYNLTNKQAPSSFSQVLDYEWNLQSIIPLD